MKILLFSKYDQAGASSRYRTYQYLNYLRENDLQIDVNPLLDHKYITKIFAKQKISLFYYLKQFLKRLYTLLFKKNKYDLCWIEGELFPYVPFFIERLFLPKKYITDYDDAIFHNYNLHKSKYIRLILGNKIDKIMRYSSHVIAGNEYIKNYAISAGSSKVSIVPTVVDGNAYKPGTISENTQVIIGWLGSPTTVKYLNLIKPVFLSIAKKLNIKLYVIGGIFDIQGIDSFCHHWPDKWSESEEIKLLNQIDIGIMPLIDSPWERGKCGFKLIKYMACGKPVIASPVSSNCEVVEHGLNGYLAHTLDEWENYLFKLANDKKLSNQFGNEGRKRMVEKYSLQSNAPILYKILFDEINISKNPILQTYQR